MLQSLEIPIPGDRLFFIEPGVAEHSRGLRVIGLVSWQQRSLSKRGGGEEAPKKQSTPIPPGAKWLTVNPSGVEGAGHPILVQPHEDGSATVIGGADGKLNMLKLRNVGNEDEWKARAKQRRKEKKEKQEKQSETQKEDKEKVKAVARDAVHGNAYTTVKTLEDYGIDHGLTDAQKLALQQAPDPGAEPEAIAEWQENTKSALERVKAIQQAYEHKLVTDHDARAAALVDGDMAANRVVENQGHVAATDQGEELAQLVQLGDGKWLARSADGESDIFDSWKDAAIAHLRNTQAAEQSMGMANTQPTEFYSPAQWTKEFRPEQLPEGFEFRPEAAIAIAKLNAERKNISKAEKKTIDEIDAGKLFDGITLKVKEVTDQEVISKLATNAKTLQDAFINDDFLKLVDELGDKEQRIKRHAQVGGYAKLAEIASDVLKQNPLSRAIVDAVGHNEAAKILAFQMKQVLSPEEYKIAAQAQAAYHGRTSAAIAKAVHDRVKPISDRLRQIHEDLVMLQELTEGDPSPEQQIQLDTLTYDADALTREIQQTLGTTLGQLQASAAMTAALEANAKTLTFVGDRAKKLLEKMPGVYDGEDSLEPSLFESFGLTSDDYDSFDTPDGDGIRIHQSGLEKLAQGYDPDDTEAYEKAMAIKRGDFDEPDFVPAGFSHYHKDTFTDSVTEAQQFDTSLDILSKLAEAEGGSQGSLFDPSPAAEISDSEVQDALQSYIGARCANGEDPLEIMNDVRSPEFYLKQGLDPNGAAALRVQESAANLVRDVAGGGNISTANIRKAFQALGDSEAAKQRMLRKTDDLQALHSQELDSGIATEALHRSLSAMPLARTVFKDWKDLTAKERSQLRIHAIKEVMGWEPKEPMKAAPPDNTNAGPVEMQTDIFGNMIAASEVAAQQRGDEDTPELSQWQEFSKLMGGDSKAYAAVRDHLKGQFFHRFANGYGAIAGKAPMIGNGEIAHVDKLLLAKMPEDQRAEMLEFMRARDASDQAKGRSRTGGKFAAEVDDEWLTKYEELKGDNRQISLLTSDTGKPSDFAVNRHRTMLGDRAESQLHDVAQKVIGNFAQIDSPVSIIPEVNWSKDTPHATKQRALKFLEEQRKVGIHFGAGSGKSAIMLGCFSHLHAKGKVKKALICVPSSIVGQFIGEAATFLESGKYNYVANMGMSREERLKNIADPNVHIFVSTRESVTNDLLYLVEKHHEVDSEKFRSLPEAQQKDLIRDACKAEGLNPDELMFAVDEAHDITARKGVDPSKRSLALNGLGHHSGYYVQATGDAIKNDLSEMYNFLHSVAPDKYSDMSKFMAEYGANTDASRRSLQRAIAPYSFSAATKPFTMVPGADGKPEKRMVKMNEHQPKIPVNEHIATERQKILDSLSTISAWQTKRREELKAEHGEGYQPTTEDFNTAWDDPTVRAAVDHLGSDDTWHSRDDASKAAAIGGQVRAIGGLKRTALWRLYHRTDYENNPKMQWTVDHAIDKFKTDGKPSVVFSASSQAASQMVEAFKKKGMRVAFIHGGLDSNGKDRERLRFQSDQPEADILVCTDAARTGVNLTRGKVLYHFDAPLTEMSYSQRSARIHRLKQDTDTEIYTPMLDAPEERQAWARMERKGKVASPLKANLTHLDESGLAAEITKLRQQGGAIAS